MKNIVGKYHEGVTVCEVSPICSVLASRLRGQRCDRCFKRNCEKKLSRCSGCKVLYFCGTSCQEKQWPLHKNECEAIRLLSKNSSNPLAWFPTDTVRLLFYFIQLRNNTDLCVIDPNDPKWKESPFDLCSHSSEIRIDLARSEQFTHVM